MLIPRHQRKRHWRNSSASEHKHRRKTTRSKLGLCMQWLLVQVRVSWMSKRTDGSMRNLYRVSSSGLFDWNAKQFVKVLAGWSPHASWRVHGISNRLDQRNCIVWDRAVAAVFLALDLGNGFMYSLSLLDLHYRLKDRWAKWRENGIHFGSRGIEMIASCS